MKELQFEEGPEVPLLVEGMIDADTLRQLVLDLSTATTILQVREKGGPAEHSAEEETTLDKATGRLLAGNACAVQVRYCYSGYEWSDTIVARGSVYRVVRCRQQQPA